MKEGASVRYLEREAKKKVAKVASPFARTEERIREALQTKVNVTSRKNRGKVIIEFYSKDDLERIAEIICGGEQ